MYLFPPIWLNSLFCLRCIGLYEMWRGSQGNQNLPWNQVAITTLTTCFNFKKKLPFLFSHKISIFFVCFYFLHHRKHCLNITNINLLLLVCSYDHPVLCAPYEVKYSLCHGSGGGSPASSLKGPRFGTGSVYIGFMVDELSLGEVLFGVMWFIH